MASLTQGDNIDWLWGSLKPWQILHSTLAERQRCGNVLDVWELVNETLSASSILTRGQGGDGGRSHGPMQFLGDIIDGDFWRHGGVMESRVKECLNALKNEEEAAKDELVAAHPLQISGRTAHHHHHQQQQSIYTSELAITGSTQLPCCTHRSISQESAAAADADDQHYCKMEEHRKDADDQEVMQLAEAAAMVATAAAAVAEQEEEGIHSYTEEDEEEDAEEEEEEDEDSGRAHYMHTIREANYSLITSNYQADSSYREISRDTASILVVDPYCSAAAGDDQAAAEWGEAANLGEVMAAPPDLEENIEVCAVCLEKLTDYYEEGVQALACRHAFHTVCIAPWLQRQPHACCPCCRGPIFTDNLAPPLHLAAPLHLTADHHDRYACAGLQEEQPADIRGSSSDIMGLLADMEAALEHLGFRC